jgi:cytochrome c-type biogenesis protein CcmF
VRQFTDNFYLNEHLFYGHLGHLFIITAFVTALFVFILGLNHFLSADKNEGLLKQIRTFFWIHLASVFGIFLLLIFLFKGQYFEYHYIWRHSSRDLPWYYILSAMWEGQEGSFILWIVWQAILAIFLVRKSNDAKLGALASPYVYSSIIAHYDIGCRCFWKTDRDESFYPLT